MNILIVNCSPVRNGATAEIVKLAGEYVGTGNNVNSYKKNTGTVNHSGELIFLSVSQDYFAARP